MGNSKGHLSEPTDNEKSGLTTTMKLSCITTVLGDVEELIERRKH